MYTILLADNDPQYRDIVFRYFSAQNDVQAVDIATDGYQALEKTRLNRYDALLMDLVLPRLDGLGILETLGMRKAEQPAVMVACALCNESMIRYALTLGARYYIHKPVEPQTLYRRMLDMLAASANMAAAPQPPAALSAEITYFFLVAGLLAHNKGYHYLREGIRMVFQNPALINKLTKELYPRIAKQFSTTSSKVERDMRHAIEAAWQRGTFHSIRQFYGTPDAKYGKPTNGEFIALIADRLLMSHCRNNDNASVFYR